MSSARASQPWPSELLPLIEESLDQFLPAQTAQPEPLHRAMRYAVFGGGKRLRPLFLLKVAQAAGLLAQLDPLVPAGEKYLDRWTQVDASVKKLFNFGKHRIEGSIDLFNALNSNVILQRNQAFGTTLDQPQQILQPRLIRLSAQWKF